MKKRFSSIIALFLVSYAAASDISWKTFDIKVGPAFGGWNDVSTTMIGGSISLVKPITPYVGAGVMAEFATDASACEDCADYDFNEFSGGLLLNLNAPISSRFSLVANFMFLLNFQDGTVDGLYFIHPEPIEAYDAEGNSITAYTREKDNHDYEFESFMFRSNLGVSWRTQSDFFGLEFYPIDFAVVRGGDARMTFSLNAVFRLF